MLWVIFGLFWVPHLRREGPPPIFGEPIMDGQANISARRGGEATSVYIHLVLFYSLTQVADFSSDNSGHTTLSAYIGTQ